MSPRISRDQMLLRIAEAVAQRSTCSRLHVGAVISKDYRTIATGYNGVPSGLPHCNHSLDEVGGCKAAVHAEANAIAFAARIGASVDGAELMVTHLPCYECSKLIINSGIVRVRYDQSYRDSTGLMLLCDAKVDVEQLRVW